MSEPAERHEVIDSFRRVLLEGPFSGLPDAEARADDFCAWLRARHGGQTVYFNRTSTGRMAQLLDSITSHLREVLPEASQAHEEGFRDALAAAWRGINSPASIKNVHQRQLLLCIERGEAKPMPMPPLNPGNSGQRQLQKGCC